MKDTGVAIRYARALFEAARKKGEAGKIRSALGKLSQVLRTQNDLSRLLLNSVIPQPLKEKVIVELIPQGSPPILKSFLKLLIKSKRLDLLYTIAGHFDEIAESAEGLKRVSIRTPQTLTEEERRQVVDALSRVVGCRVVGDFGEAPDLIGGLLIKSGDKVLDMTIAGRLASLKKTLAGF